MTRRSLPARARRHSAWLPVVGLLVAGSCTSRDGRAPAEPNIASYLPAAVISDGSHAGGTAGFYFLPPMVPQPVVTGTLDMDLAAVEPVVVICDVTSGPDVACGASSPGATPALRTFTISSDPAITFDDGKYRVNWDTGEGDFSQGRLYRIHVFAGQARRELGFADVLLTQTPGQAKNSRGDIIVLKDGRTLPIHFRIEEGVVPRIGPAQSFELTGLPATLPSGDIASVTVIARDQNGNVAVGYRGTVTFTSSNASATLPANYTFTEADAGTHTFTNAVAFVTAGAATVRVTDVADANLFGETPLTITPRDAVSLDLTGLSDPTQAGTVSAITVTARDANGNIATGYTGTVAFTSTDPLAALPEPYTFTAGDGGTHHFASAVTLRTAGSRTVTATDQSVATITDAQTVTVAPAAASRLVLAGIPPQVTAGVATEISVTAHDEFGNVATGYIGTVQFSSSDPAAILPAPYAFQTSDLGTHTFTAGVTLRTAGEQNVQVVDADVPTLVATASTAVSPAAASQLRFSVQPSDALAGSVISPPVAVTAYDPFENLATGFTGQVGVMLGNNPGGATLSGAIQAVAVAGVATFSTLTISAAGLGYTLVASASGVTSATSEPFDVIAPVPVEVHWTNAAGGLWSVGTNWSTGAPPTPEQTALIDLPGTYTVTMNVDASVNALTLGASSGVQTLSTTSNRTLTVLTLGTVLGTGRMTLSNSAISGSGTLAIATGGSLTLSSTSIVNTPLVNAGSVFVFNAETIAGQLTTMPGSLIHVQSVGFGGASLTVANGFTNNGGIVLTSTSANGVSLVVGGTLLNATDATIDVLPGQGGGRTLATQLVNDGTINVRTALTLNRSGADHLNNGTIAVSGGNLVVTQSGTTPSFTNDGSVTVSPNRVWTLTGGAFTHASGAALDGGGALSLNGVNPAVFQAGFALSALSLSGVNATFGTALSTADLGLTINNSTLNGAVTLTNAEDEELTLSGATAVNMALVNEGTLVIVNASTLNGGLTTAAGSTLRVLSIGFGGASLTVTSGFSNNGLVELTSNTANGVSMTVNGTLLNAEGSIISVLAGQGGTRTLTTQLDNRGTLTISAGVGLTLNGAGFDHSNAGTINVVGGNLAVAQSGTTPSFTNTGTVAVSSGRTWAISGGSFTNASAATIDGAGVMSLSGVNPANFGAAPTLAALTLSSTVAGFLVDINTATAGTLTIQGGTLNGPGTITNASGRILALTSGTINTPLSNEGTVHVIGASALNGVLTTSTGSVIRAQSVGFGGTTLTIANGFTNNGLLDITATVSNGCAVIVNGTLVNAADGTITIGGVLGGRTLTAQVQNAGTLTVGIPLTINRGSADHINSGSIAVTGGDLTFTQSGTTPTFANSGSIGVTAGRALRIGTGAVTNESAGSILGPGTFEAGTGAPFDNQGSVTVGLARIGNSIVSTGSFAPTTAEFFGTAATIPVGAGYAYTNVRVLNAASFGGSVTLGGNLTVVGTGNLTIGGQQVSVSGDFATQNTSVLTMQNPAAVLAVAGNAAFGGGSTNTRLTAGTLRVGGTFTQGGGNAAAFAASGSHVTVLGGSSAQAVSFANPGATAALSHFHRLEIENPSAAGITMGGAIFATGQLRTPAGATVARVVTSAGHTLQVGGLDAAGLILDHTPLRVVNGDALARFDDAVFRNMDPATTQFRLDRLSDAVTFNNTQFQTVPTTGAYLHLVDTDLLSPVFTVTMQGTQPPNHGGRIIESVAGQLQGWPF